MMFFIYFFERHDRVFRGSNIVPLAEAKKHIFLRNFVSLFFIQNLIKTGEKNPWENHVKRQKYMQKNKKNCRGRSEHDMWQMLKTRQMTRSWFSYSGFLYFILLFFHL